MQELNPVHIKFLNMVCTKVCNFKYVIINTGMKEKNERQRAPAARRANDEERGSQRAAIEAATRDRCAPATPTHGARPSRSEEEERWRANEIRNANNGRKKENGTPGGTKKLTLLYNRRRSN